MKLQNIILATALLAIGGALQAQTDHLASLTPPGHPRILLLQGEENAVKKTIGGDKIWIKMQQATLDESDKMITLPPVERIKIGRRLLDKSR